MTDDTDTNARAIAVMQRILDDGRAAGHGRGTIRQRIQRVVTFGSPKVRLTFLRDNGLTRRKAG